MGIFSPAHASSASVSAYLDYVRCTPLRELMPTLLYPKYMPNTPSLLVLRVPPEMQGGPKRNSGCLSDGYKAILIETEGDRRFAEGALSRPLVVRDNIILAKETIDKTNLRESRLPVTRNAGFLHYAPTEDGWPHLLVIMSGLPVSIPGFIRQRYAVSYYGTEDEVMAAMQQIGGIAGQSGVPVRVKFGDST
jgi:hypothetical protein